MVQSYLHHYAKNTIPTTLAITSRDMDAAAAAAQDEEEDTIPMDPILHLTNRIASLIDSLSGVGCELCLWLQTTTNDERHIGYDYYYYY